MPLCTQNAGGVDAINKEQADEETIEAVMVVTDAKGRKHNNKLHLTQANK